MKVRSKLMFSVGMVTASLGGCLSSDSLKDRFVPAEEFSRSVKAGHLGDYSIFRAEEAADRKSAQAASDPRLARASLGAEDTGSIQPARQPDARAAVDGFNGDPRLLAQGMTLKKSFQAPTTDFVSDGGVAGGNPSTEASRQLPHPPPALPPGSGSPYATGQMTANPSLWPDESQSNLFTDFRAFQAMDVITIIVNESSVGSKKTKANAEGKYSLLASIAHLLGFEAGWESNNNGLSSEALVQASTESKYEGKGEMKREGALKAALSAVIMEVLPNGLMRIEGSKIVSVDDEEEVMVISGLVRSRDINSQNQIESNRVANMRIDFYGKGTIAQTQSPGWGARIFSAIWPF
ncbi:MAG: flagellar basal body L-ring protein FlgH [Bdellovibrionota bacterium]